MNTVKNLLKSTLGILLLGSLVLNYSCGDNTSKAKDAEKNVASEETVSAKEKQEPEETKKKAEQNSTETSAEETLENAQKPTKTINKKGKEAKNKR